MSDLDCAIAQAAGIVGDWWTLLIVRDVAGGTTRFEALQRSLGVSRKVLTERLGRLVDDGVLRRVPYQDRPARHEYLLTEAGVGLLPVLVSLQDWGTRYVMATAASPPRAPPPRWRPGACRGSSAPACRRCC